MPNMKIVFASLLAVVNFLTCRIASQHFLKNCTINSDGVNYEYKFTQFWKSVRGYHF